MNVTNDVDVAKMTSEEMAEEIVRLRAALKTAKATIDMQSKTIDSLRSQASKYYRAASDYVPMPERDYDR